MCLLDIVMKIQAAVIALCLVHAWPARAADHMAIALEGDIVLCYSAIQPTRNTPHVFVQQALESLAAPNSTAVVLASRQRGLLGKYPGLEYSLIAFKPTHDSNVVRVEGEVWFQSSSRAFFYGANIPAANWSSSVLAVVEAISTMPSNDAFKGDAHKCARP